MISEHLNVLIIVTLALLFICMVTYSSTIDNREHMTLKTFCDYRDTNCLIACTYNPKRNTGTGYEPDRSRSYFNSLCYRDCIRNSPNC